MTTNTEQQEHDRWVKDYPDTLLLAAHADLWSRKESNPRNHDERWILARRGATSREILRRSLSPA
jgi:hypothetical protein